MNKELLLKARQVLRPIVNHTPLVGVKDSMARYGCRLFLKGEHKQVSGSFKYRGANFAMEQLSVQQRQLGVVTHSSGNHGRALAEAAKRLNSPCTVVVPENAPDIKIQGIRDAEATIRFCEPTLASRESTMKEEVEMHGYTFVPPFDHDNIILGQSTCSQEIIEDLPEVDKIIAPVGGGGLLSGTCLSAHFLSSRCGVYGAEPKAADDAFRSIQSGKVEDQADPVTIGDGLRTTLSEHTFGIIKEHCAAIIRVSEVSMARAMKELSEELGVLIEPSSATALAAFKEIQQQCVGQTVVLILTGGNIDRQRYNSILYDYQLS